MADDPGLEDIHETPADRSWWQAFGQALLNDELGNDSSTDEIRDELRSLRRSVEQITSDWFMAGPGREIGQRLDRIERRLEEMSESRG